MLVTDEMVKTALAATDIGIYASGRARMRAALEAVAPAIRAAALEEALARIRAGKEVRKHGNGYSHTEVESMTEDEIIAAILALKDKEPT